jgi:arylsulfatase
MARLPIAIAVFALMVCTGAGCRRDEHPQQEPAGPRRPNVLLVTLDTTRADAMGPYGQPGVDTPVFDNLARTGVLFERAFSTSQGTNPSHASIHTGLYVSRHRVNNNRTLLDARAETLAEVFAEQGYATLAAVSVRHIDAANTHFDQGFETFLHCDAPEMRSRERNETDLEETIAALARGDRPFFAWVHYYDPHGSYRPPPPFDGRFEVGDEHDDVAVQDTMDIDDYFRSQGTVDPDVQIALYKGEVAFMDGEIGALLGVLEMAGARDDTTVAIMGDHGESLTEHGVYFCHRGLYNPTIHVPFLIHHPGTVPGGVRVESLVSGVDVFPTLLELAGIDTAGMDYDGTSLVPSFTAPEAPIHEAIFSETVRGAGRAVLSGEDKFIKQYGSDPFIAGNHLFRTFEDYGERDDLLLSQPERADELEELLERWYGSNKMRQLDSKERTNLDRETIEALEALGYADQVKD